MSSCLKAIADVKMQTFTNTLSAAVHEVAGVSVLLITIILKNVQNPTDGCVLYCRFKLLGKKMVPISSTAANVAVLGPSFAYCSYD